MALNPQYEDIGKGFVQQYYHIFDDPENRANVVNFYSVSSVYRLPKSLSSVLLSSSSLICEFNLHIDIQETYVHTYMIKTVHCCCLWRASRPWQKVAWNIIFCMEQWQYKKSAKIIL